MNWPGTFDELARNVHPDASKELRKSSLRKLGEIYSKGIITISPWIIVVLIP